MSQTDDLPALPETPFGLFHECPGDDDSEGWHEFLDCPGYTADQMGAYATAARAPLLERIAKLEAALMAVSDCWGNIAGMRPPFGLKAQIDAALKGKP